MGWWSFADWCASNTGLVVLGLIAVIVGFVSVAFSMKSYALIQKIMLIPAIGGVIVLIVALFLSEQGRLHRQLERDRRPSTSRSTTRPSSGRRPAARHVGLARHVRRLQRRLRAVRLQLRDRVPQRRGQAPGQGAARRQHPRRVGADRPRLPHRARPLPHHGVQLPERLSAAQSFGAGVEGYTAPFNPDYLTLTWIASGKSGIVAWAILLAFIAVIWLEITIAILIVGRAWLAWGLDRMGPKWFTDVSPQFAQPFKNLVVAAVIFAVGVDRHGATGSAASLAGLVGGGLQFASVFLITGIVGAALPVPQERARHLGGVAVPDLEDRPDPIVSIGAVLYLAFIIAMLYYSFIEPTTRLTTGKSLILFVARVGRRHHLVLRLEGPQQEAGHRRQHHLRRAAAGVTPA